MLSTKQLMKVKQTRYLSLPDHRANKALYYFLARELEMRCFQLFVHLAFVEPGEGETPVLYYRKCRVQTKLLSEQQS